MPVEFIGMIGTKNESEIRLTQGPAVDPDYVRRFARAHEDAGFDRVLIGYSSARPDGTQVAAYAAAQTERLGFLVAHRPGFVAPTLAARTFATLDQFTRCRIAVHVITGGSDAEQRRDGDYLSKDERYDRTDEYLDIMKRAWTSDAPFSYHGKHYQVEDFYSEVRSPQQPRIKLYFGGSSEAAYRVGGKQADVFALWGEPLAETKEQIDSVNAAAATRAGRSAAPSRRTAAASGCWPPRPRASCTTAPCGPRCRPLSAPRGTPPPWSARLRPWRRRLVTTSTSA